jgi:hypothetical protein
MAAENSTQQTQFEDIELYLKWEVAEREEYQRSKRWYIIGGIAMFLMFVYALWGSNYLFAGMLVLISFIYGYTLFEGNEKVPCAITNYGIILDDSLFEYKEIKTFSIVTNEVGATNLYLRFNSRLRPLLPVPLDGVSRQEVQEILGQFIEEDEEMTEEPVSDYLARKLKL